MNLIIEDIPVPGDGGLDKSFQLPSLVSVGIWTDRMVIWTRGLEIPDLAATSRSRARRPSRSTWRGTSSFARATGRFYADRMYYDASNHVGTVLSAEMLTPVPRYEGKLRLRAEVLRQVGRDRFVANDAFFTSSRLGSPGYRLQAASVYFEDVQEPRLDPATGLPVLDPKTQEPAVDHRQMATGENNVFYLDDLPVFYWPTLATDLKESSFYLRRVQVKNDTVYGFQAITDWDMYQLLGIRERPAGTDWGLSLDWLGKRGFGHGTVFRYNRDEFLGIPGKCRRVDRLLGDRRQRHRQPRTGPPQHSPGAVLPLPAAGAAPPDARRATSSLRPSWA